MIPLTETRVAFLHRAVIELIISILNTMHPRFSIPVQFLWRPTLAQHSHRLTAWPIQTPEEPHLRHDALVPSCKPRNGSGCGVRPREPRRLATRPTATGSSSDLPQRAALGGFQYKRRSWKLPGPSASLTYPTTGGAPMTRLISHWQRQPTRITAIGDQLDHLSTIRPARGLP